MESQKEVCRRALNMSGPRQDTPGLHSVQPMQRSPKHSWLAAEVRLPRHRGDMEHRELRLHYCSKIRGTNKKKQAGFKALHSGVLTRTRQPFDGTIWSISLPALSRKNIVSRRTKFCQAERVRSGGSR